MSRVLESNLERMAATIYSVVWIYILFALSDYTDTLFGIEEINTIFAFFPIALLWGLLPILLIVHGRVVVHSVLFWLILAFTSIVLYGSIVTIASGYTFQETFLRYVVIMASGIGAICIGYNPPREGVNRFIVKAGTFFSFFACLAILFHHLVAPLSDVFHILKEELFFTVAVFASRLFSDAEKSSRYRLVTHLLALLIIVAGIITTKFTTYFCVLFVLACYSIHIVIEGKHVARTLKGVILGAHAVLIAIVLLPLYFPEQVDLPDGSPVARNFLYTIRWEQFMESPWFGTFFVGEQRLVLFRMTLSAHSNTLDILAFGGLLCMTIYIAICAFSIIAAWRIGRRSVPGPFFNGYGCLIILLYVPVSATFNPIWGQVGMGACYWMTVGLVAGTMLRLSESGTLARHGLDPKAPPSPPSWTATGTGTGPAAGGWSGRAPGAGRGDVVAPRTKEG